jgi:hypothetical protein
MFIIGIPPAFARGPEKHRTVAELAGRMLAPQADAQSNKFSGMVIWPRFLAVLLSHIKSNETATSPKHAL